MMLKNTLFVSILITLLSCSSVNSTYTTTSSSTAVKPFHEQIKGVNWRAKKVHKHLRWNHHQFPQLFSSVQSITVVEIKLKKSLTVAVDYVARGFTKTSDFGRSANALLAINGSFFNTKVGGSNVFLKKEGRIISETAAGFDAFRENAGITISDDGTVDIVAKPTTGWQVLQTPTVLTSGPLLLMHGNLVPQQAHKFNTKRHPRTAIGLTEDGRLLAVVVDGRSANAQGVTIEELSQLMLALGCEKAMNLDGGGSSTAWIKGEGVVNYPSDNKQFDHQGERAVANAILINIQ